MGPVPQEAPPHLCPFSTPDPTAGGGARAFLSQEKAMLGRIHLPKPKPPQKPTPQNPPTAIQSPAQLTIITHKEGGSTRSKDSSGDGFETSTTTDKPRPTETTRRTTTKRTTTPTAGIATANTTGHHLAISQPNQATELQLAGCHISELRSTAEARAMKGSQSHEFETDVPASELWEIYGTFRAVELLPELLPHILAKAELVSGDGGVGTIVQLTLPPGIPGLQGYKEKYIKVDNENYIKEAEAIDGDILKLGFLSYMIRLEIIGKGPNSSVIRTTIEYEIDDGNAELESMVSTAPMAATAERLAGYIKEQKIAQTSS